MGITIERKYNYDDTIKIVKKFMNKVSKKIIYETICYKNDAYPTYVTYVKTNDNKLITRGNGKGIGKQSELSSIFESIEHSFYESYMFLNLFRFCKVKFLNYEKLLNNMISDYEDSPVFENMKDLKLKRKLPCLRFKSFTSNKNRGIYLPLFMYGPSYPFPAININEAKFVNSIYIKNNKLIVSLLKRDKLENYSNLYDSIKYCSSVGGASGIDLEDTLLHAINEVIERDATSEFLLSAIIYGNYNKYSIIDSNSLDESNKKILNFLNQQYDLDVVIIDITGHLGIPTIMVYERNNQYGKETLLTGFGTSTNVEYAIERALLEYKQTIDLVIYDNTLPKEDNYLDYLEKNKINDFFKKIYYFDRKVLENIPVKKLQVIEENCKNQLKIVNVNKMLTYILRILKEFGYEVYYYDKKRNKIY